MEGEKRKKSAKIITEVMSKQTKTLRFVCAHMSCKHVWCMEVPAASLA